MFHRLLTTKALITQGIYHDTRSRGMSRMSKMFTFEIFNTTLLQLKMLNFDANPIRLNIWLQSCDKIIHSQNNSLFVNISKAVSETSDSFPLIMSHFWSRLKLFEICYFRQSILFPTRWCSSIPNSTCHLVTPGCGHGSNRHLTNTATVGRGGNKKTRIKANEK